MPWVCGQSRACLRTFRQLLPMSVCLGTGKPAQRCCSLPFPAQLPAAGGLGGDGQPCRSSQPGSIRTPVPSIRRAIVSLKLLPGSRDGSPGPYSPLYIAVTPLPKQKGTRRGKYPLVNLPGEGHLVSRQAHTRQIRTPGLRQAAPLLPALPRTLFSLGLPALPSRCSSNCWDGK